jgi:peptide/nickel transport system permease protein
MNAIPPGRRRSVWRSAPALLLALIALGGVLAPLLANDVPLVARSGGTWLFPAFAELVGDVLPAPGDRTWSEWRAGIRPESRDFALMPPWPHGPLATDLARADAGPSLAHWLGCDDTGRDVLSRLLHGASAMVRLVLPAVLLGGLVGTLLGAWAGCRGGIADVVVSRAIDVFACFPTLLFLLFAASFFGDSRWALVVVLASVFWLAFARVVRGELLGLRERDWVHTARGLGVSEWRIATRHLLPQVSSQVGVTAAFCAASAVVAESTLTFLGLGGGVASSWGTMLRQGADRAVFGSWHLWAFPALALIVVVVCCHLLADRLRRES